MRPRRLPLWLVRYAPAFLGIMFSFWQLMILVIRNGSAAMHNKKICKSALNQRRSCWRTERRVWISPSGARPSAGSAGTRVASHSSSSPHPGTSDETAARFETVRCACMDLKACVRLSAEDPGKRRRVAKQDAACASAHAPVRAADSGLANRVPLALILSSAQSVRPSKDERGHACAPGPPLNTRLREA